jgi:hypothetical protein
VSAASGRGRAAALALLLLAAAGCAGLKAAVAPAPEATPGARPGWLGWRVGGLQFEAPEAWTPSGDARRLGLDAAGAARLEAWVVEERFADGKACLAGAEEALARGEAQLSRVRRHATTLAGRPAVVQEADAGGWHGWAYAVCQGGEQHRLFFTGRSPIPGELLEAWRGVVGSVRLGGGP